MNWDEMNAPRICRSRGLGTATCHSFVSDDPVVGLLCYCWNYTSRFRMKKKKKRRERERGKVTLAETTLFWHLYIIARLSPILTWKICKLAATLQSFMWFFFKSRTVVGTTLFWCLYVSAHLLPILTLKICRLADFRKLWNRRTCMYICRKQSRSKKPTLM